MPFPLCSSETHLACCLMLPLLSKVHVGVSDVQLRFHPCICWTVKWKNMLLILLWGERWNRGNSLDIRRMSKRWKVKVTQLCLTVCDPMDCPWHSPGQNTGRGSLSLLQRIFPTQELNWNLLHCRWILYQLSYQGSHPKSAGGQNL